MRKVTVVLTYPRKCLIGAKAISWWIGKPYSHAAAVITSDGLGLDLVYHAAQGMVHFMSGDNFKTINNTIVSIELTLTDEQYKKLLVRCISLAGQPYGYLELAKILINDITHRLGFSFKFKDSRGYICSELLADLLQELGFVFNKPLYLVTPDDIEKAAIVYGKAKIERY